MSLKPTRSTLEKPFGFIVIDKPAGLTSHDCVNRLRKVFGIKKIGHSGTLDPAVTGVLPIAIGDATRLISYLQGSKAYTGIIQLGDCLLYTSPSPRDATLSRMPSSA